MRKGIIVSGKMSSMTHDQEDTEIIFGESIIINDHDITIGQHTGELYIDGFSINDLKKLIRDLVK